MSERAGEPTEGHGGPIVPLSRGGPSIVVIATVCAVLGLGLFLFLEAGRAHRAPPPSVAALTSTQMAPATPPLSIPAPPAPPPPPPAPAPEIRYVERPGPPPPPQIQYIERPASQPPQIAQAPASPAQALVVDLGESEGSGEKADDTTAHATVLHDRAMIVPQGMVIPAVLETPIDSSAAGMVRAVISTDTRGFDGTRLLIPRGSRLYGQYQGDTQLGQSRVLVTWTRLVRPDGVSVRLNSSASDARGGPGVPGSVDNHTLERLGSAALQSALAVGVNVASRAEDGAVIVAAPSSGVPSTAGDLFPAPPKPTIRVPEGAEISVFVARDLDFAGALPRS